MVTLFGMVMLVSLEQPEKVLLLMSVILLGMSILVRLEQPENTELPMLVMSYPKKG